MARRLPNASSPPRDWRRGTSGCTGSGLPSVLGALPVLGALSCRQASGISANWGRWVKLTEDSADVAKKLPLVKDPKTGNFYAIAKTQDGHFAKNLQFVAAPGSLAGQPDQPGDAGQRRGAHVAARDAAGHGRDQGLPRHDRREGRRRAARPEGRGARGHDRSGPRYRGGHDHPGARGPGRRGRVVEGAGARRWRSRRPRGTRCSSSTGSRRRSRTRPSSATSPRPPRRPSPRSWSG